MWTFLREGEPVSTHGYDTYFAIEDSAGTTLRNISVHLNSVDFNRSADVHEDTTFGKRSKTKKGGLKDGQISLAGFWDKTALTGSETVLDSLVGVFEPVDWEFGPEGNVAGKLKKSGKGVLSAYNVSDPIGDLIAFTATVDISGDVTTGVFP
jgi:hypothetical protein